MSQTAAVAAEYEQRLSRLLAGRFGGGQGGLARVADRAAPFLPNDLVPCLRQLIADLVALRSGRAEVDDIEKFRASADAIIAALAAALPTSKPQESRGSLRRAVFWHLLVALAVPFVGLALSYELKINTPLIVGILLFWAWGGYLYWVIDRIIQMWLVPSAIRRGLRTIVAFLFFWCPVALVWAVLQFIDWRRRYASHVVEYEQRLHPSLLENTRAIENLDSVGGAYISDDGYTTTPTPFKSSI